MPKPKAKYLIDATPARERLHELLAAGRNLSAVSFATGVHDEQLRRLAAGRLRRCIRPNVEAILALEPWTIDGYPERAVITGVGVRRRIQALHLEGWSRRQIATAVGWATHRGVNEILHGKRDDLAVGTVRRFQDAYVQLSYLQPPGDTGQARGAITKITTAAWAAGWAPRIAWDDDTIDDPRAAPAEWLPSGHQEGGIVDVAEVAFLLEVGLDTAEIAERLDRKLDTIQTTIRRHGLRQRAA